MLLFGIILWFILPLPKNVLLAPVAQLTLNVQGKENDTVSVTWLNNGFGDISYSSVELEQASRIGDQSIQLPLSENDQANLSWRGRVWQQFVLTLNSSQPLKVIATIDGLSHLYSFDPKENHELNIVLPVKNSSYYQMIEFLILPPFLISLCFLWLLINFFTKKIDKPANFISRFTNKITKKLSPIWVGVFAGFVYGILALVIFSIGYFNRLYVDDFCYLNIYRRFGFLGAILNNYQEINGRFASHVLNYLAFSLGKGSIPFGPIIVFFGLGWSLYYLLIQLLFPQGDNSNGGRRRPTYFVAILFTLIILVCTSLVAPDLYESLGWTLHALIVTGSLFLINIFFGLVLYFTSHPKRSQRQISQALIFALIGFCAMGFSEPAWLFLLVTYGLLVVVLIVKQKLKLYWGMLAGFAIGASCGLVLAISAPGSANRVGSIGFSNNPSEILTRFYSLVQDNFLAIFFNHTGIGLFVLFVALLLGYVLGRTLNISLRFEKNFPSTYIGIFTLIVFPLILTTLTFLPSALLNGYLPSRTLIIPLYLLVVQYFILSVYWGRHHAHRQEGTSRLLVFTIIMTLIVGVAGLNLLLNV